MTYSFPLLSAASHVDDQNNRNHKMHVLLCCTSLRVKCVVKKVLLLKMIVQCSVWWCLCYNLSFRMNCRQTLHVISYMPQSGMYGFVGIWGTRKRSNHKMRQCWICWIVRHTRGSRHGFSVVMMASTGMSSIIFVKSINCC